jgi:hypothetical protein
MPNWTSNTLKVKGNKSDRDAFAKSMADFIKDKVKPLVAEWVASNPDKCRKEYELSITPKIDFNFVIPMPKELEGTTSPRPKTRDEIMQMAKDHGWDEESLKWRLEHALSDEDAARLDELKSRFGYDNWYEWCIVNWGTKWNACHSEDCDVVETAQMTIYRFSTAWSPPAPFVHALAIAFPKLTFRLEYTLEGESGKWSMTGDPEKYEGCRKALKEQNERLEQAAIKIVSSL